MLHHQCINPDNTLHIHLNHYPDDGTLFFRKNGCRVQKAYLKNDPENKPLNLAFEPEGCRIDLSDVSPHCDNVVVLQVV